MCTILPLPCLAAPSGDSIDASEESRHFAEEEEDAEHNSFVEITPVEPVPETTALLLSTRS